MKQFISLCILLTVLSSCGTELVEEPKTEAPANATEQTIRDIDEELAELETGEAKPSVSEEEADPITEANVEVTEDSIKVVDGDTRVEVNGDDVSVVNDDWSVTINKDWVTVTWTAEIESVEDEDEVAQEAEAKVTKVQALYNNSRQDVVLDIEYTLDSDGKIGSIEITDTNGYDVSRNLWDLNVLVGKSIDEVEDTYISGGSLTVPAIKKAIIWS